MSFSTYASSLVSVQCMTIDKSTNNFYLGSQNGNIYKVDTLGNITTFSTGYTFVENLVFDNIGFPNGYMFVMDADNTIFKVDKDGNKTNYFTQMISHYLGLAIDNSNNLYYTNGGYYTYISKIDTNSIQTILINDPTLLIYPQGITIYNNIIYVSGNFNYIVQYDLNGTLINNNFITIYDAIRIYNVTFSNNYIYVGYCNNNIDNFSNYINIYNLNGNLLQEKIYNDTTQSICGLTLDSSENLYFISNNNSDIIKYTAVPISNICFPAGTPITTCQGPIPIEKINTDKHTIRNKSIVGITRSVYASDKYLVCFEKDCLGTNIPSQKTVMSKNHKLFYNGNMVKAYTLVGLNDKIKKIKYNGEVLYNVLMEEHDKMIVNNLICETLHPENNVAKLYKICQNLNIEEQVKLIDFYNKEYKKANHVLSK